MALQAIFSAEVYTYTLYFREEKLTVYNPQGEKCVSGETLVQSSVHPFLAFNAAARFFDNAKIDWKKNPGALDLSIFTRRCSFLLYKAIPRSFLKTGPDFPRRLPPACYDDEIKDRKQPESRQTLQAQRAS